MTNADDNVEVLEVEERWRPKAIRAALCLVFGVAAWLCHERNHSLSTAGYMLAFLFGGWDLTQATWEDLRELRFTTNFLMLLVAPASIAVGAWGEGALLLFLFSTSASMEAFANGRTHREIRGLLRRAPKTARLLEDGGREREVPVTSLVPGDRVRVIPGEQVPVDGDVMAGESACDESNLTGESEPVRKAVGENVLGGTLNLWGSLDVRVTRPAGESALQRIIRMIENAQQLKAPTQRFTDRFGTGYTALVITLCLGMFLFLWLTGRAPAFLSENGDPSAFYRAMTLLVVMSPCALVLSVPSAILSAIAFGARHGVLFRGGAAIENLAEINVVALDKTGTLTEGNLHVVGIDVTEGAESEVLALAAGLAGRSSHPVSRAVSREVRRREIAPDVVEGIENVAGKGLRARKDGEEVALGNREFITAIAGHHDAAGFPPAEANTTETWVHGPQILGRLRLRDELRPQSRGLLEQLRRQGIRSIMLTGDRAEAAQRIGTDAGVDEVLSRLHPDDKVAAIQRLKAAGKRVAMIGDGVNDAPSLAAADVSVAMGARGSDAAIEQAEVVLMHDRLENFLLALNLSRRARAVMRQNLVISLGTLVVMSIVAVTYRKLSLSVGVAAHEGSTVVVVLNSLRLLFSGTGTQPGRGSAPGTGEQHP